MNFRNVPFWYSVTHHSGGALLPASAGLAAGTTVTVIETALTYPDARPVLR